MTENPPPHNRIRVLLVEDDEDDHVITRDLLARVDEVSFELRWARSYADGLRELVAGEYDVVLLDYRLGEHTGLDFLGRIPVMARTPPVILLTGQDEQGTDMAAMRAGAADYLSKQGLNSTMLERSIRYAVERMRQEEELRETQIRFASLAENMSDAALIVDSANTIVYSNPATDRIFGYGPGELTGRTLADIIPPAARQAHEQGMARYLATGIRRRTSWSGVRLSGLHRSGAEIPVEISFGEYARRGVRFFTAVIRDVTERVTAEAALLASEERLRRYNRALVELAGRRTRDHSYAEDLHEITALAANTLDVAQAGVWTPDQGGSYLVCSSLYARETGVHSSGARLLAADYPAYFRALREERVIDAHDAQRDPRTAELTAAYLAPARITSLLDVPVRLRGRMLGVLCLEHVGPARHWNVEEQAFAASLADQVALSVEAAERELAEQAQRQASLRLAAAEAHYRRLVTASPQAIYALDAGGRFIELNPSGERLLGRAAGALRGRPFADVVAPGGVPAAAAAVEQVLSGRAESVEVDVRILRPSGEERQVSMVATRIVEDGQVTGLHGIARDVTDEMERDRQVRLLAGALEGLQEQGVSIVDAEGRALYWNRTHARLLGHAAGDPAPGPGAFVPDEASRREMREIAAAVQRGGSWSGRVRRRRASDGAFVVLDAIVGKVRDEGRTLFFMIVQDAGEKIAREQHLRRVERLASVGTLLSGVAHELNNPLSAVLGFAQLLLLEPRSDADRDDLLTIAREAERMAKIVSDLRLLARDTQEEIQGTTQLVDLNDVVRHVLRTRDYSLKTRNIDTREEPAAGLPPVLADRGQMEQVLLNLVINAEQALESVAGERRLTLRTRATGSGVSVQVADTGPGIAPGHLDRIFDPFFTTKEPGEGTGLGLSLVHSIVSEHAGRIHVDSEPGRGTVFRIDLPAAPHAAGGGPRPQAPPPCVQVLRVLVVDDEEAVRHVVVRHIQRRGHVVDEAPEGARALALLDGAKAPYDVIVSDLRMPGLDGEALLRHLRERGGGMADRVVFLTGDTASVHAMRTLSQAQVPVLAKPSGIGEVVGIVEKIGAAAAGAAPRLPRDGGPDGAGPEA